MHLEKNTLKLKIPWIQALVLTRYMYQNYTAEHALELQIWSLQLVVQNATDLIRRIPYLSVMTDQIC